MNRHPFLQKKPSKLVLLIESETEASESLIHHSRNEALEQPSPEHMANVIT